MRAGFQGGVGLVIALASFLVLAFAIRSFFVVVLAAAGAAVLILHFWNKRPVKAPEDDQVRLHLNDDDPLRPK